MHKYNQYSMGEVAGLNVPVTEGKEHTTPTSGLMGLIQET